MLNIFKFRSKNNKADDNIQFFDGVELYRYKKNNGEFDYDLYKKIQTVANKNKINNVWVQKNNIIFLAYYLKKKKLYPKFGLCHGTRQGFEQKWFSEQLDCEVLGTEISDTANNFKNTIQWDFHEIKKEWIGKFDFIYSNSLDHAYDPEKCINNWVKCLSDSGICIIEHSTGHTKAKATDPFGAQVSSFPYLVLNWANGAFSVREILREPKKSMKDFDIYFFIIMKNV